MITAKRFDLGNVGYTTSYYCSNCSEVFEINILSVSEDTIKKPFRFTSKIEEILFCPFCGKEA